MRQRCMVTAMIMVLILASIPLPAFAQTGATCRFSCGHSAGSAARGGAIVFRESDEIITTTTTVSKNSEGGRRRQEPELQCTSQNGGVISIEANWSRKGSPGYEQCLTGSLMVNSCTGMFVGVGSEAEVPCPDKLPPELGVDTYTMTRRIRRYEELCAGFEITMTSFTCITEFDLQATVGFPGIPIHTKPYPSTLVRYDTYVRIGGLPSSSGSNSITYIPWGGGKEDEPARGDWRFVTLTITASPKDRTKGWIYLEHIGWIELPVMELYRFQWQQPSHPASGGGPLAGAVGQLEELPQDMPLLENYTRSAYLVVCELTYQEWEYIDYLGVEGWVTHTDRLEITPDKVPDLPEAYGADTDGDGSADAFWNMGVVVLRMNDAFSVEDPVYAHSYSWGEVFYWAVREGQGQISFP